MTAIAHSSIAHVCSVEGCDRQTVARGFCKSHYRRFRANGTLQLAVRVVYPKTCIVDGCSKPSERKGYCQMHYRRLQRFGRLNNIRQPKGSLVNASDGYIQQNIAGVTKMRHVWVAESALGHELPYGAEVHHVNQIRNDNRPTNLVICPDRAYHMLLHARQRAFDACGHAEWRKCSYCGRYDDTGNMGERKTRGGKSVTYHHKKCAARYARERKALSRCSCK